MAASPVDAPRHGVDGVTTPRPTSFTCPECGTVERDPADVANGYCNRCKDWTGVAVPPEFGVGKHSNYVTCICGLVHNMADLSNGMPAFTSTVCGGCGRELPIRGAS